MNAVSSGYKWLVSSTNTLTGLKKLAKGMQISTNLQGNVLKREPGERRKRVGVQENRNLITSNLMFVGPCIVIIF
jgi:hypothetical protein